MNKFILGLVVSGVLALNSYGATASVLVKAGTMTNLLYAVGGNGPLKVTQIVATAGGTTVTNALIVDAPTNSLVYTIPAYTNYIAYATNQITVYTNYFGATTSSTNLALVRVENGVASATGSYPVRMSASALANTSTIFDNVNYYFNNGIWATNPTSGGDVTLTFTYQR